MKKLNKFLIISLCFLLVIPFTYGCGRQEEKIKRSDVYESFTEKAIDLNSNVFKDPVDAATALGINFTGIMETRMTNAMNRWMYSAYYANPAMIEMLRQRESVRRPVLQAWYGEFSGKYITSAALFYSINYDENLKFVIDDLVEQLKSAQTPDGYLGPFAYDNRLTGNLHPSLGGRKTWDLWGHYHIMRGLLLWYEQTENIMALEIAQNAADHIIDYFANSDKTLADAGESEKNLSIAHGFAMMYRITGNQKYLDFTNECMDAWELPGNGDFYRNGVLGVPFYQLPTTRWEGFHCALTLAEMYNITGSEEYKEAYLNLWKSIRDFDRHNNGGATTRERTIGTPYQNGSIETCATIAWANMTVEAAKLSDDPTIIDELELTTMNAILGAQSPSGRWFTYNTPMDGERKASAHEIVFQAIPGSPELNCCSVNGPVGLGLISKWAVASDNEKFTLNYYGAGKIAALSPSGNKLLIEQETGYPAEGEVKITLHMDKSEKFSLRFRIPSWSIQTDLKINGESFSAEAGKYSVVERLWKDGDIVELSLDLTPHFWIGAENRNDHISIYTGPILLSADERFNKNILKNETIDLDRMTLDISVLEMKKIEHELIPIFPQPIVLYTMKTSGGDEIVLCDFATAGMSGTRYTTWIPATSIQSIIYDDGAAKWIGRRK